MTPSQSGLSAVSTEQKTASIPLPTQKPARPYFSSGPCVKRPGWTLTALEEALVGRSHRSKAGKKILTQALEETRALLELPKGYQIAIVPASDTGAVEMALWSLLGACPVDLLAWESFGQGWVTDGVKQLRLAEARVIQAPYGELPNLSAVNFAHDVVFTWNGTTSGVRVPDAEWIPEDRSGLTICDATSGIFAQALDFTKLDVVTFSWQKVLGGEAAHGILILSPRAVERLETYTPAWPLPKIFRLTKQGKFNASIFAGETINTPSMLCVADYLDALSWARSLGGGTELIRRADANAAIIAQWVEKTPWIAHLARVPETRSNTSVCLKIVDPNFLSLDETAQRAFVKRFADRLEAQGAAYDINAHRDAPPGIRIWTGATVEAADLKALLPWLDWAFAEEKINLQGR